MAKFMNLSEISTKELVNEIGEREAVEKIMVKPYEDYQIIVGNTKEKQTGPAIILKIWD